LWAKVRNKQFFGRKFFRQFSIRPYILDCGQRERSDKREYDAARSEYLKAQGIDVIRFWNNDVLLDIQSILSNLALMKVTPLHPPLT
jgi:very-short-patch-repair endonuclease